MEPEVDKIRISVVYAETDVQHQVKIECPVGTTIGDAIDLSGIRDLLPGVDISRHDVGVFGYKQEKNYVLDDNDRIEIYRALTVSPTEARRLRADAAKKKDQDR